MTTWPYDYDPSGRQKDPQFCFVGGSGTLLAEPHVEDNCCERLVDTQSCQIGVVGLSLKLSRTIGDFPKDHVQGPLEILGAKKDIFATPSFCMGVQLHPLDPSSAATRGVPCAEFLQFLFLFVISIFYFSCMFLSS